MTLRRYRRTAVYLTAVYGVAALFVAVYYLAR